MKIISKFKDYYDSVLGYGHDDSTVYVRDRSVERHTLSADMLPWQAQHDGWPWEVNTNRRIDVHDRQALAWARPQSFEEVFVCVAGKAHAVFARTSSIALFLAGQSTTLDVHGDVEPHKIVEHLNTGTVGRTDKPRFYLKDTLERFTPLAKQNYNSRKAAFLAHDFTSLHLQAQAPVVLVVGNGVLPHSTPKNSPENVVVVRNPCLKDLNLQRVLDPYTAFQDISQFISGVVPGQHMPMVQLSDKDQIRKKGFDPKYGFRTRPQN